MSRAVTVAAAQMGPVQRDDSRADVVDRLLTLLHDAHALGAELVVYPELALTTFFPRWYFDDERELDTWFETEMPSVETKPLFDEAARLGVGLLPRLRRADARRPSLQHADPRGSRRSRRSVATARCTFPVTTSTSRGGVPTPREAVLRGRPRGVPGVAGVRRRRRHGDLQRPALARGLPGARPAGRRADPHRVQHAGPQPAGAGTRSTRRLPQPPRDAVGRVPERHVGGRCRQGRQRGGRPDDRRLGDHRSHRGDRALCTTLGDEVAVARCDLSLCDSYKQTVFDFARHRQIEHYGRITSQRGAEPPP